MMEWIEGGWSRAYGKATSKSPQQLVVWSPGVWIFHPKTSNR